MRMRFISTYGYILSMVARAHAAKPPCHTHVRHVNSALRSGDSYKTENADDGKAKSRDTRATNCEAGTRERPANPSYLRFLVGVAMHPWVSRTSVFLAGYFTQTPFHTSLHKHNTYTLHSVQDFNMDT